MLRDGILPPADGEETQGRVVPPNPPPLPHPPGLAAPGSAQAYPARAVPARTAPAASLERGRSHKPAASRAALSRAPPRAVSADLGPRTPDGRESHPERVHFCMCLFHVLVLSFFRERPAGYFQA